MNLEAERVRWRGGVRARRNCGESSKYVWISSSQIAPHFSSRASTHSRATSHDGAANSRPCSGSGCDEPCHSQFFRLKPR